MLPIIDIFKAIILGLTEGLTEFIPVSSTAHLLLLSWMIEFNAVKNHLFEVVIQSGAILAVCVVYRRKLTSIFTHIHRKESKQFFLNLILSFLPAAFVGTLFHDFIKQVLFSPVVIGFALVIGGFIIIIVDSKEREPEFKRMDEITPKHAFLLGIFQAMAVVPGVSRSGATIIGGLLLKISRKAATEFSFFMSVVVISAASAYDLLQNYRELSFENIYVILAGFISAFLSAIFVIKWLINYVSKNNFVSFGIYRIMFGSIILFFVLY